MKPIVVAVCNKKKGAHVLARVEAQEGEPVLRINIAVVYPDHIEADWSTVPWRENAGMRATCACRKEFPVFPPRLQEAYRDRRVMVLEPLGLWLDPHGVMDRRHAKAVASDTTPRLLPAKPPVTE